VKRIFRSFPIQDFLQTKTQVLHWSHQSGTCVFLDSHTYHNPRQEHECIAAAGVHRKLSLAAGNHSLENLQEFIDSQRDWCFGHLGYALKEETLSVKSSVKNRIAFPDLFFFIPEIVIKLDSKQLHIGSLEDNHEFIFNNVMSHHPELRSGKGADICLRETIDRDTYLSQLARIQSHIARGDCYELNYCIEFFAEQADLDPLYLYQQLASISPNPFAAYYRLEHLYLICASPERFIGKRGAEVFSQPIKGTMRRNTNNVSEDNRIKSSLLRSNKERSEHVMIVDLVRNDLSRVCAEASVQVEELFGIYTFPHLHHMISTVRGQLRKGIKFSDIMKATFPMGSMTGAPKKRVLELIDQYEPTARGMFSGTLGYINPEGDFDFNVVIRSIVYNQDLRLLSYHVGSGITGYADAEKEYEECLLKAEAIERVLKGE